MALEKRRLKNDGKSSDLEQQTITDHQDTNSNDTFGRFIKGTLITASSIAAWRSGILKPIAKGMKEYGGILSENMARTGYKTGAAIKDWSKIVSRNDINDEVSVISKSLFNQNKSTSLWYDIIDDIRHMGNRPFKQSNIISIINDTRSDIEFLSRSIQKANKGYTIEDIHKIKLDAANEGIVGEELQQKINAFKSEARERMKKDWQDISESNLFTDIRQIDRALNKASETSGRSYVNIQKEFSDAFLKRNFVSEELAAEQTKKTGFRYVTLGDILDFDVKENELIFKDDDISKKILEKISINEEELSTLKKTLTSIKEESDEGIITLAESGKWKNLLIDAGLSIEENNGKVLNTMYLNKALEGTKNSLMNDFKLPVLGFNPIKAIMNLRDELGIPSLGKEFAQNRLNYRELAYAYQNGEKLYAPVFTGQGTRRGDDVNKFFQKKFGTTEETFGITFANGKAFATGSNGTFEQIEGDFNAYNLAGVKKGFQMPKVVETMRMMGGFDLNYEATIEDILQDSDAARKMGTTDLSRTLSEYKEQYKAKTGKDMTRSQQIRYTIGRYLEIGRQELKNEGEEIEDDITQRSNADEWADNFVKRIVKHLRTNGFEYADEEAMKGEILTKTHEMVFGEGAIAFTRKAYGIKPIYEAAKEGNLDKFLKSTGDFFGQHFAGFRKDYSVGSRYTEASGTVFNVVNALDRGLNTIGLGLSMESKKSAYSLTKNLLLKRALPVFMLTQIPGMINYFSEPLFTSNNENKKGESDNATKTLMREVVKPMDLTAHKLGDITGFNKAMKYLLEMTPGSEHFTELPGVHMLGLGQTKEEREEYIKKGYDPVRKNRYWSASNTPFTGSKIDHWRPNIYRRTEADVKYSDTMYGSRKEYYSNTWYPNLVNPLAPIRHFITDPHHWDNKHYSDRPYAMTASKGENIPIIGPIVGGTIGQIYQKKMHEEYWNKGKLMPVNINDEKPTLMESYGISNIPSKNRAMKNISDSIKNMWINTDTFNNIDNRRKSEYIKSANQSNNDIYFGKKVLTKTKLDKNDPRTFTGYKNLKNAEDIASGSYSGTGPIPSKNFVDTKEKLYSEAKEYPSPLESSSLPYRDYNRQGTSLDVYTTPSGQTQIVDVPENLNLYKVNKEIKHYSLNKIYGTNQRVDIDAYNTQRMNQQQEQQKPQSQTSFDLQKGINNLADVWGLKGFLTQSMITGQYNQGTTKIEDSGYNYSGNRSFWDKNLGGLGGELSEISRRFIPKKEKNVEYLNPIRNTMPVWMPGSSYFTDYKHGDPYSKIMNGEERLPGEGYEKLNNINLSLGVTTNMLANSQDENIRHFLQQDTNKTYDQVQEEKSLKSDNSEAEKEIKSNREELASSLINSFGRDKVLIDSNVKINDETRNITGEVDAVIRDMYSDTGYSLVNIRGVNSKEFDNIKNNNTLRKQDYYEMNYDLFVTNNQNSKGYIYYYDRDNPNQDIYKAKVNFNRKDLESSIKNLYESRQQIIEGLKTGEIKRGDLYSLVEKYKILADTAPYSQEFKDISAQVSHAKLSKEEREEISAARERMQEQKQPLRVYDYKFKTANLKDETVTVKQVLDNNTILVNEYGRQHAIKFAGINVSESNSTLYEPSIKEVKGKGKRSKRVGKTMNEAAREQIEQYLKPGSKITISYDNDNKNKFGKDSTESIKAVITAKGKNINKMLLNQQLATEKKDDNSPASIRARYSKGDIAFGSIMETLTHTASNIPFIGDKFIQVRSPYEQYRKREVYNKDFKSWNNPVRDYLIPTIQESSSHPIAGIAGGAFIGSLFGKSLYGKLIGGLVGATIPAVGNVVYGLNSTKDRAWRPKRRRQQEELNTYIDTLKYVKNINLYNKYKELAKKEDNFDVDKYLEENKNKGQNNKDRKKELNEYKKKVKLDYKHRKDYNFKYGDPKYATENMSKKDIIKNINKELAELSNERKVEKLPINAIKAITYKQNSEKTMYAYEPGDDIRNIMAALPKKERQYYSKFVKAPEEEKQKILQIAPSYLRRALQASWGMKVDEKPTLEQYFSKHALPGQDWTGWNEDVDLEDVKVKMVHANGLDPGEFDIWSQDKVKADQTNIPVPKLHVNNNPNKVANALRKTLNGTGMKNININYTNSITSGNSMEYNIKEDPRDDVSQQITKIAI